MVPMTESQLRKLGYEILRVELPRQQVDGPRNLVWVIQAIGLDYLDTRGPHYRTKADALEAAADFLQDDSE